MATRDTPIILSLSVIEAKALQVVLHDWLAEREPNDAGRMQTPLAKAIARQLEQGLSEYYKKLMEAKS
jgi:hypothetical protein